MTLHTCWMLGLRWGGVNVSTYIERKITSVVHSHPPSHYMGKHAPGWLLVMVTTRRMQIKLNALSSMLTHCTVHMLRTISLHFLRMKLNGRHLDGSIVFQRLGRFATSKPSTSLLWYAALDIPTFCCAVTCVLKDCESHTLTSPLLTRTTPCNAPFSTFPAWARTKIFNCNVSDPEESRLCEAHVPWKYISNQGAIGRITCEFTMTYKL